MEEIQEIYYLVKVLNINVFAFDYYLKQAYPQRNYPTQVEKWLCLMYKWNVNNRWKSLKLGHYSIQSIFLGFHSPFYEMNFSDCVYQTGTINGFVSKKEIDADEIRTRLGKKDSLRNVDICQKLGLTVTKAISSEDDPEALEDLLEMLGNIKLYNSFMESPENPEEGYLSYFKGYVLNEIDFI